MVLAFVITGCLTVISSLGSLRLQRIIERRQPSQPCENDAEPHDAFSAEFWARVLEEFLIQLSDQQLLLGLVVLVCAFTQYYRTALGGNDNFWHAADVACFSMLSHAATVLALRAFFRANKKLAAVRIFLMITIFALWATIGYYMIHPDGPHHKTKPIIRFWRGATYIEFVGITWAYILTCAPIFVSNEAIAVGRAISSNNSEKFGESLRIWQRKCIRASRRWYNPISLLELPSFIVMRLLFSLEEHAKWKRHALGVIYSVFFSRTGTAVVLFVLWLFTLSALGVGFISDGRALSWDFGQRLSLSMVALPLHSLVLTMIPSTSQFNVP